ncbi:hypothetical protein FOL47_010893, partial [Perkinsus chesapeaki]
AAVHWYTFDQYDSLKEYNQKYLKSYSLISTEATNSDPIMELHYKTDWDRAVHYAHGTIVDFVYGGSSAFVDWAMTGDNYLITVKDSETFVYIPSNSQLNTPYYVFGQITKYFKPGYHLLTSLDIPDPGRLPDGIFPAGMEAMAAISPDRTEIVLAILCDDRRESNATISEFLVELDLGGGYYSSIALKNIEERSQFEKLYLPKPWCETRWLSRYMVMRSLRLGLEAVIEFLSTNMARRYSQEAERANKALDDLVEDVDSEPAREFTKFMRQRLRKREPAMAAAQEVQVHDFGAWLINSDSEAAGFPKPGGVFSKKLTTRAARNHWEIHSRHYECTEAEFVEAFERTNRRLAKAAHERNIYDEREAIKAGQKGHPMASSSGDDDFVYDDVLFEGGMEQENSSDGEEEYVLMLKSYSLVSEESDDE